MVTRKTLSKANAEKGYIDSQQFDAFSDADIERLIAEDADLAPPNEALTPVLEARDIRRKLGLTQRQFAAKLGLALTTVRAWERDETPADPLLQVLLRILDRDPEMALRALDEPVRRAG
jgi:putative transcriptional regulator